MGLFELSSWGEEEKKGKKKKHFQVLEIYVNLFISIFVNWISSFLLVYFFVHLFSIVFSFKNCWLIKFCLKKCF